MVPFRPFKIFTPSPILGYGFDIEEFWQTIQDERPAAIILDAGSTDPGPYMLGTGKTLCSRESYIRDLKPILDACARFGIKLLISSAGGAGTNEQVDALVSIIGYLADLSSSTFKLATIKFDCDRATIIAKHRSGQIEPCASAPDLTEHDISEATQIVAQMGAEPFQKVLQDDQIDIIVSGRSYDPAPFAAFCMSRGVQPSPAWHVGKIIECGGLCTVPKGRSILATMYEDSFVLTPTKTGDRCTPVSVAAHTLYEKTRPDRLPGPGGTLYLEKTQYIQQPDGRSVLVKGSEFLHSAQYQIKLEGAEHVGYRSTFIGGIRDPILIAGIDDFLETVRSTTTAAFPDLGKESGPQLIFHLYGKNAVMGPLETSTNIPHEIGVLGEIVAETQDLANAIAGFSRTAVLHGAYTDQLATSGNLASPLTPLDNPLGAAFKFSLYHLMTVDDPTALFAIHTMVVGHGPASPNAAANPESALSALSAPRPEPQPVTAAATAEPSKIEGGEESFRIPTGPTSMNKLAKVIRSKNSGPFEITLDICFDTIHAFGRVRKSGVLSAQLIQNLYALKSPADILVAMFYEPALAWKCTFKRPWPQGSVGERDTFGAQMHAPLLSIIVPADEQGL